jgi:hypothetical protein
MHMKIHCAPAHYTNASQKTRSQSRIAICTVLPMDRHDTVQEAPFAQVVVVFHHALLISTLSPCFVPSAPVQPARHSLSPSPPAAVLHYSYRAFELPVQL